MRNACSQAPLLDSQIRNVCRGGSTEICFHELSRVLISTRLQQWVALLEGKGLSNFRRSKKEQGVTQILNSQAGVTIRKSRESKVKAKSGPDSTDMPLALTGERKTECQNYRGSSQHLPGFGSLDSAHRTVKENFVSLKTMAVLSLQAPHRLLAKSTPPQLRSQAGPL